MFIPDPNDLAITRTIQKLMAAGWIHQAASKDSPTGSDTMAISFTPLGVEKLGQFLSLLQEIGKTSIPIAPDEVAHVKWAAEVAARGLSINLPTPPRL